MQLKVLIVDDELGMQLGVKKALTKYIPHLTDFDDEICFDLHILGTGLETIEYLKSNQVDILILDHKLPDITGLEVLESIDVKSTLTIMITAFSSLEVAISATKNGAFDFLAKPFALSDIRSCVFKAAKHIYIDRKAKKAEEEKRQLRFEFISVLAHELKAPLSAIEGYLHIMEQKVAGDSIDKYTNTIGRSLGRISDMRKMICDLLDLTKIESGNRKRSMKQIDLSNIVKWSIGNVDIDAKKRNININYYFHDEPLLIEADSDEMKVVFNNLLTNAVKYNRVDGKVDITISRKDSSFYIIECKDTGIGMTKEEQKKLFSEFSRIKNNKTKDIPGSGLGLSILQKVITLYKGQIEVDSEADKGTTFRIILPVSRLEAKKG